MDNDRFMVRIGRSLSTDEKLAVREFREMVDHPGLDAVIFFCSSKYNLEKLGRELAANFDCPLIGCTTAGEISSFGYQEGGIVGAGISSGELRIHRHVISPLSKFSLSEAGKLASSIKPNLSLVREFDRDRTFGLILIDGLSMLEEVTIASLYTCFEGIPIIGGSAGDDQQFKKTCIYDNGQFIPDAAVFTVFETTLPFLIFQNQHFKPTDKTIVITGADPERRIITEINGEVAAVEYARILGLERDRLSPAVFSENPLLLRIGGTWHVRSVQKSNPDESLSMFSAIEEGLVMSIGKGDDLLSNFARQMAALDKGLPPNRLFILCDCILRRLELNATGKTPEMDRLLRNFKAVGFSTYGEQFNSIHVNQTLTGVVIGG
ncbi:MAG: FIST N-terminal domain-containing protein [Syntrophaceae bacterium]